MSILFVCIGILFSVAIISWIVQGIVEGFYTLMGRSEPKVSICPYVCCGGNGVPSSKEAPVVTMTTGPMTAVPPVSRIEIEKKKLVEVFGER